MRPPLAFALPQALQPHIVKFQRRTAPRLTAYWRLQWALHPQGKCRALSAPAPESERDPARDEDRHRSSLTLLAEEFRSAIEE
jgi:hypothetical protein